MRRIGATLGRVRTALERKPSIGDDPGTNRPTRHARANAVRWERSPRARRSFRAPAAAFLLSLLVFVSPELTLAPLSAREPITGVDRARPIDQAPLPLVPRAPAAALDRRAAGLVEPTATTVSDAPRFEAALWAARDVASSYGVSFAAIRDGALLWTGSVGRARDGQTKLAPDSQLVIGSATKTFVAAAILQLVEEGRLALDDSARKHLPALGQLNPKITIAQLLDHTSGLADVYNDTTRKGLDERPERAWTTDEILQALDAPWYKPGEGWAYANTNYYLLGMIIERLTGSSLADELGRRFLSPLHLDATEVLNAGDPAGPMEPAWASIFWASGAMTASAADLARWGNALYTDGVLEPQTREQMLKLNSQDYGYGVQRIDLPGARGYGHTGLLNAYTTMLVHLPRHDVTMALLVNRAEVDLAGMLIAEPRGGGPSLFELATGEKPPRPTPAPTPSPQPAAEE